MILDNSVFYLLTGGVFLLLLSLSMCSGLLWSCPRTIIMIIICTLDPRPQILPRNHPSRLLVAQSLMESRDWEVAWIEDATVGFYGLGFRG